MKATYRPSILMRFNIAMTVFCLALAILWAKAIGFRLPGSETVLPIAIVAGVFLLAGLFYAFVRKDERVAQSLLGLGLIQFFVPVSGVLSYLGATLRFPMQDATFVAIDRAMGFDWLAMVHWAADKPRLVEWLGLLYDKPFFVLPFAIMLLLIVTNRGDRFEELVGFVIISTVLSLAIGSCIPGISAFAYFQMPDEIAAAIGTPLGKASGDAYFAIRNGVENWIDLSQPRALIAFPSYHTVVAVMLSLYVRHIRWLLVLMIPISAGIVISTPLIGGHYLIDTLGGIALAFFSCWAARRIAAIPLAAPDGLEKRAVAAEMAA